MTPPLVLTWARSGDVIAVANTVSGFTGPMMVLSECGAVSYGYYCEPCRCHCANLANLIMHLDSGGAHHVALWCEKHRSYEEASVGQVEGFAILTGEAKL